MAGAELRQPHGQFAVALEPLVEYLDVARTVHQLDHIQAIIGLYGKHVVPKLVGVT